MGEPYAKGGDPFDHVAEPVILSVTVGSLSNDSFSPGIQLINDRSPSTFRRLRENAIAYEDACSDRPVYDVTLSPDLAISSLKVASPSLYRDDPDRRTNFHARLARFCSTLIRGDFENGFRAR